MTHPIRTSFATLAIAGATLTSAQDAERPDAPRGLDAFHTYSQRAWGDTCVDAGAPACWLEEHFTTLFPDGLVLGDLDGLDADEEHALVFDSAEAVAAFLPIAPDRPIGTLTTSLTNPTPDGRGLGGALAGELLAAELNAAFDARGLMPSTMDGTSLVDLIYVDGVADALVTMSVGDVIGLAHGVLAGRDGVTVDDLSSTTPTVDVDDDGEPDVSARDVHAALATFNANFTQGELDGGRLASPVRPLGTTSDGDAKADDDTGR